MAHQKTTLSIGIATAFALAFLALPGQATDLGNGMSKMNIYDETYDVWNVHTGTPDPVIGFVNFLAPSAADPNNLTLVVALKKAAPNCTLTIEVVTDGTDPDGGLGADSFNTGWITVVGTITTNGAGNGNTGAFTVDVRTIFGTVAGEVNYAHIDLEPYNVQCMEKDGTAVWGNEYGASSSVMLASGATGTLFHWMQP